jgi:hypothetical protein
LKASVRFDGIKGLKEEYLLAAGLLHTLYSSRGIAARLFRRVLDFVLRRVSNHMTLLVVGKR